MEVAIYSRVIWDHSLVQIVEVSVLGGSPLSEVPLYSLLQFSQIAPILFFLNYPLAILKIFVNFGFRPPNLIISIKSI